MYVGVADSARRKAWPEEHSVLWSGDPDHINVWQPARAALWTKQPQGGKKTSDVAYLFWIITIIDDINANVSSNAYQ